MASASVSSCGWLGDDWLGSSPLVRMGMDDAPLLASARTALVVENDPDLAGAMSEILQEKGFVVHCASDLVTARASLAARTPSVLALDLLLPDASSTELLEELAGQPEAPPTVVVSGHASGASVAASFGLELVMKPFDIERLVGAVDRAIRLQKRPRSTPG